MTFIVFLRATNVGGYRSFKPSSLAKELGHLELTSYGAAGTFIVRGKTNAKSLREEISRKLPFKAELMICPASEILELVRSQPFGPSPPQKDVKWFVSIMDHSPRNIPKLPFEKPSGEGWIVRIVELRGQYALSLWRHTGRAIFYPNEVVEKNLGVLATTRGWNTITSISGILGE